MVEKDNLGHIIKEYRRKMTYIDKDGNEKCWTQADLAKRLGLSEVMVNIMEKKGQGLDSFVRRQLLVDILRIPPALLGLAAADVIEQATAQTNASEVDIELYKDALGVYSAKYSLEVRNSTFADGHIVKSVHAIEAWIKRMNESISYTNPDQQKTINRILWQFHMLAAKIYGYYMCNWLQTLQHLNQAKEIAEILNDIDLKCMELFISGNFYIKQNQPVLA